MTPQPVLYVRFDFLAAAWQVVAGDHRRLGEVLYRGGIRWVPVGQPVSTQRAAYLDRPYGLAVVAALRAAGVRFVAVPCDRRPVPAVTRWASTDPGRLGPGWEIQTNAKEETGL